MTNAELHAHLLEHAKRVAALLEKHPEIPEESGPIEPRPETTLRAAPARPAK